MKVQVMGPEGALLPPVDVVNYQQSGLLASFADDGEPVILPEVDEHTFALVQTYMATEKVTLNPGEEEDKVLKAATYLEVYPLADHINALKLSRDIDELMRLFVQYQRAEFAHRFAHEHTQRAVVGDDTSRSIPRTRVRALLTYDGQDIPVPPAFSQSNIDDDAPLSAFMCCVHHGVSGRDVPFDRRRVILPDTLYHRRVGSITPTTSSSLSPAFTDIARFGIRVANETQPIVLPDLSYSNTIFK